MTFKLKDPGSAITHFIGMMMALLATIPLLVKAAREPDWLHLIALSVFALSMFLLYTASTTYHSLDISAKVNRRLQKMDHMMIFVLIAGSYTPICLIALKGHTGKLLCILVWSVALVGIIVKACWITCPKWFSSVIYIGMGGYVCWHSPRSFTHCPNRLSDGFSQEASSIRSAVLSMH